MEILPTMRREKREMGVKRNDGEAAIKTELLKNLNRNLELLDNLGLEAKFDPIAVAIGVSTSLILTGIDSGKDEMIVDFLKATHSVVHKHFPESLL